MRNACTSTLYDKFSYDTREIIKSERFRHVFPEVILAVDKQNLGGWNLKTSRQIGYFGAGVGGTIIGFGASGVAITDDLYKSIEDALSAGTNEKVNRWKESAHDSRLEKNCPTIDIGTRWTENDIIGRGIERKKYDLSIVIAALDDEGKSFCEDVKTTEEYLSIKNDILQEIWEAEYMQAPAEIKGRLFREDDFNRFSMEDYNREASLHTMGYIDVMDQGTDSLAFPIADIFPNKVFVTDVVFQSETIDITVPLCAALINAQEVWKGEGSKRELVKSVSFVRVEANNQGTGFIREIRRYVAPEKILPVNTTTNKNARILNSFAFVKKYFYFRNDYTPGSDYERFMKELLKYMKDGSYKKDDAPDSIAGLAKFIQSFLPHLFS